MTPTLFFSLGSSFFLTFAGAIAAGGTVVTWYGLFATAGTPRDVVNRLHGEVVKALASPDVRQRLTAQGFDTEGNTPEQFTESAAISPAGRR